MRVAGWESALSRLVGSRLAMPFAWGRNDCATFAADAVLAITGVDRLEAMRGRWHDTRSAMTFSRSLGGLVRAVTSTGLESIPPALMRDGDIAVFMGQGETLAVCLGDRLATPGKSGLVYSDMKAKAAWRV